MTSQSVLSKSARGSAYNIAVSAITIVLGFVRSVLLMRLLTPDPFGFVALALFFVTFLTPFSTFGIDSALIQRQRPGQETFSTHLVVRLTLAIMILVLGLLASPVLRRIYAEQVVVVDVFLVLLGINVLRASFSTPGAILRRDMRFGAIAWLNLLSSLAMTITAPLLAYLGAGLWSLVVEQAVGPAVRWVGLWVFLRPWRLSLRFDWDEAKSLLRFGRHVLSANVLGILLDRFDDFWIGTVLGPTQLGYYSRAYEVAQYPERVLATPITSVFYPAYATLQEDREELSRAFFRSSSFLVRVGLLVATVLVVTAPEVTVVLFGETWLPIVPVFRLMLVYIMLDPLYVNLSYLIIGAGRPDLLSRVRLIQVLVFILAVIAAAHVWGINGVAIAADLMMVSGTLALTIYSRRFVRFSLWRMFWWPAVATAASAGLGLLLLLHGVLRTYLWGALMFKALSLSGVYILILYLAERRTIREYGSRILQPIWHQLRTRIS
jgi:O-antigen/teichoic acid export membrane protein